MRQGKVYNNDILAGYLTETDEKEYVFHYDDKYFFNTRLPPVSVTLPERRQQHRSKILFPFFFNMLSEGSNRQVQCRMYKLDDDDHFGLLLKTAANETIGAIRVEELKE